MELLRVTTILIGTFTATAYRSVPLQTDKSPFITSCGLRTSEQGIAVSQDLLCTACLRLHKRCNHPEVSGRLHYQDLVYVEANGFKFVTDLMNKRHKKRIDVWVKAYKDEKLFHSTFKRRKLKMWKVEATEVTQCEGRSSRAMNLILTISTVLMRISTI